MNSLQKAKLFLLILNVHTQGPTEHMYYSK